MNSINFVRINGRLLYIADRRIVVVEGGMSCTTQKGKGNCPQRDFLSSQPSCMQSEYYTIDTLVSLQVIKLMSNASLTRTLNQTFNDCDNTTGNVDCTKPASVLRHPVGALATFANAYTAPGRYWVTVWARGVVPGTNKSETVSSNISVDVTVRATLKDETGLVFLLVPNASYVDEPLRLVILIQNRAPDVDLTVDCDDGAGTWSANAVETSTKVTLREIIGSDSNRNRYIIAASSRPHSTNIDETTTMYSRLDVVHTFHGVGGRRIRLTVSRITGNRDRFTLSTVVDVRRRPTLADELGAVLIVPQNPAYVDEPVEFVYAVQRPGSELEYRLDFGDGLQWSTVSANVSTNRLAEWMQSGDLELHGHLRESPVV